MLSTYERPLTKDGVRLYVILFYNSSICHIGVFAGRQKIPKGSFIGIYAGELLTEKETEERGKWVTLRRYSAYIDINLPLRIYNKFGRTYLFELDFYYLRKSAGDVAQDDDEEWQAKYVMDAYHAGNVGSICPTR